MSSALVLKLKLSLLQKLVFNTWPLKIKNEPAVIFVFWLSKGFPLISPYWFHCCWQEHYQSCLHHGFIIRLSKVSCIYASAFVSKQNTSWPGWWSCWQTFLHMITTFCVLTGLCILKAKHKKLACFALVAAYLTFTFCWIAFMMKFSSSYIAEFSIK